MVDLTGQEITHLVIDGIIQKEQWEPVNISEVEGKYMISSYGRVRSLSRYDLRGRFREEKLLRWRKNGARRKDRPYYHVCLCNGSWQKNFKIHRLVALHFVGGYFPEGTVNHIDGDKSNNHMSNLEWVTLKENCQHRNDTNLLINARGTNQGSNKLSEFDVEHLYINHLMGVSRESFVAQDLGRQYGVNGRAILSIYRKESWGWLTDKIDEDFNNKNT